MFYEPEPSQTKQRNPMEEQHLHGPASCCLTLVSSALSGTCTPGFWGGQPRIPCPVRSCKPAPCAPGAQGDTRHWQTGAVPGSEVGPRGAQGLQHLHQENPRERAGRNASSSLLKTTSCSSTAFVTFTTIMLS